MYKEREYHNTMSNQSANNEEERQFRYLVECGRTQTMSESYHRKGELHKNLGMPNRDAHIIWCPECRKYENVIDIEAVPTRKEAEEFLNRNRRYNRDDYS